MVQFCDTLRAENAAPVTAGPVPKPARCAVRLAPPPLFRLRYIQPATSPDAAIAGNTDEFAVDDEDVSGSVNAVGAIGGEIGVGENAAVVAFSCSSKRTISATASALLIDTLQFVEVPDGSPRPSRQIL